MNSIKIDIQSYFLKKSVIFREGESGVAFYSLFQHLTARPAATLTFFLPCSHNG